MRPVRRDSGTILPLVLVVAVALFVVVLALARFVTTDLTFSRVTRDRAERQASALGAIDYGVERLRLNQTLCNAPVGSIGPIAPGILDLNGTTTTLACTRVGGSTIDIANWAVVITGNGIAADHLSLQAGGTKTIRGPLYMANPEAITFVGGGTALDHLEGDLWYRRSSCPGAPVSLPGDYHFLPDDVRGPLCTSATWDQLVGGPPVPDFTALAPNTGATWRPDGGCRVFSPGHYTGPPDLAGATNIYFESGVYLFDDVGAFEIGNGQVVWFGHNGARSTTFINTPCETARDNDPNAEGPGATAYLTGDSLIRPRSNGAQVEFFPLRRGSYEVSIHQLPGSTILPNDTPPTTNEAFFEVSPGGNPEAIIHGAVWAPDGEFRFENATAGARQQLLGGAVVARLRIRASATGAGLLIQTSSSPTLTKVELTATSTDGRGETVVRAVVDYQPDATDLDDRVAVNSLRVVG